MNGKTTAMTSKSPTWRAETDRELPTPLNGLVELMLDLLLGETRSGRSAQLMVQPGSTAVDDSTQAAQLPSRFAQVGDPNTTGRVISTSAALSDGAVITLTVQVDQLDEAATQAWLQRYIAPMITCVTLERQLTARTAAAREAVAEVQRREVLDLATGVLMAQRDCDSVTARRMLMAWSARHGIDVESLTPARILELMTADDSPGHDERRSGSA
jgi:hypothetical protein